MKVPAKLSMRAAMQASALWIAGAVEVFVI